MDRCQSEIARNRLLHLVRNSFFFHLLVYDTEPDSIIIGIKAVAVETLGP